MRVIDFLCIHCTATSQDTTVQSILNFWKNERGWINPGYHYIILADGSYRNLQPIEQIANGATGHNYNSIHICYIGGIDANGKAIDNRTKAQKRTMLELLLGLKQTFPNAKVLGHTDFEGVSKDCPSFSVKDWVLCTGL